MALKISTKTAHAEQSQKHVPHRVSWGDNLTQLSVGTILILTIITASFIGLTIDSELDPTNNAYVLMRGSTDRYGYDWWWHSLVAVSKETGEYQPFFFEYYVVNPAVENGNDIIYGQLNSTRERRRKPSYALLKAGTWGSRNPRPESNTDHAVQLHGFYPATSFLASQDRMFVNIGDGVGVANDTYLRGHVRVSAEDAERHPEYLSDAGEMSWELRARKLLRFNVGYGTSRFFRFLNAFDMYWHVEGMKTEYEGTIFYNNKTFDVIPERSFGYQDKNYGKDYTNPWVWLNCNNFRSRNKPELGALSRTSLDVGGGKPSLFDGLIQLPRQLLIAFYHEGQLYEFNFSKFWELSVVDFDVDVNAVSDGEKVVRWVINAKNRLKGTRIEIDFVCPKDTMININYESPSDGVRRHTNLWNGGYSSGTVRLYKWVPAGTFAGVPTLVHSMLPGKYELIDTFDGELGGGEYGEY
ncbi:hypothetical protein BJ742DRAFT_843039 [Cladochytrium replicatum]|nr:hypothetical protein BJ742DRAFT_843039 [Cladochytrium replicatum]